MTDETKLTPIEEADRLSNELFGKPATEIKYLYLTNFIHEALLKEEKLRSGLYQWQNVFDGEVKKPCDVKDYNDYDIIQINMSAQDVHLLGEVRKALGDNTKTKLVLNNDYTTELWEHVFDYLPTLTREIQYADMYFGTEYYQTTALSELSGKKCFVIPHPADIKYLKSLSEIPKKNIISTVWRRYDKNAMIPSLMVRNLGYKTRLIGYDDKLDKKVHVTSTLYDYVNKGTNFMDFLDQLRESVLIVDPFTLHSFSRTTIDTAAMGVPVIASNRTQSGQVCYPHTCIDPWDVKSARELAERILIDKEFRDKVIETAKERCEFYNHENSMHRYLQAISDSNEK